MFVLEPRRSKIAPFPCVAGGHVKNRFHKLQTGRRDKRGAWPWLFLIQNLRKWWGIHVSDSVHRTWYFPELLLQVACSLVECFQRCINACDMNAMPDNMVFDCSTMLKKV